MAPGSPVGTTVPTMIKLGSAGELSDIYCCSPLTIQLMVGGVATTTTYVPFTTRICGAEVPIGNALDAGYTLSDPSTKTAFLAAFPTTSGTVTNDWQLGRLSFKPSSPMLPNPIHIPAPAVDTDA